jgi:hypothetical protein
VATQKQVKAAKRNVKSAQAGARQELYEEAKQRNLPGRSKIGRDELARALGSK